MRMGDGTAARGASFLPRPQVFNGGIHDLVNSRHQTDQMNQRGERRARIRKQVKIQTSYDLYKRG